VVSAAELLAIELHALGGHWRRSESLAAELAGLDG